LARVGLATATLLWNAKKEGAQREEAIPLRMTITITALVLHSCWKPCVKPPCSMGEGMYRSYANCDSTVKPNIDTYCSHAERCLVQAREIVREQIISIRPFGPHSASGTRNQDQRTPADKITSYPLAYQLCDALCFQGVNAKLLGLLQPCHLLISSIGAPKNCLESVIVTQDGVYLLWI